MKFRMLVPVVWLGMLPWAALHAQGTGQTATTTFQVSATVNAVCDVSASDLNFGSYNAADAAAKTGTATVTVTCNPGTTYNIGLNQGTASGATVNNRKMTAIGLSATLDYQLYKDNNHTDPWGNTPATNTLADVGLGSPKPHTVYGQITAAQKVAAGLYQDTITVTIFY